MAARTEAQVKQAYKDEHEGRDPDNPIYSASYNDWLRTQPEWQEESGIAQFAPEENREEVANSEAEANREEQRHRTDYDNAETNNDRAARDRAQAEAAEQRERAVYAQTSFNPPPMPAKRPMPTSDTKTPEVSTEQVDSFVDTSDLDTSEAETEEPKKHDYISTQVRNRKKNAETRVGKDTNMETETNTETKSLNVGGDSDKSLNAGEDPHKTLPTDTETVTNTRVETPPKTDTNTETVSEPETPPETDTNTETETPPEPAPAPLPEEDLNEAGVTQEDLDDGNVDETNLEAAESGAKENGFDPETADAKAIEEAEQLGTWDKVSIGLSVASSILSALTLGILPPIDFRKFKNTDQKLEQIQQYQKDKRDAAVINNLQKEAESKGITDPQEIRQYVNDRFNSQSRNEQRTQDFNVQNKELDTKLATGMKTLEHNLEMRKLDKQTINKIKEDTNNVLGELKKIYAQGDVNRKQAEIEAKLKDWLAENQSAYDASTQADMFKYMANALKEMGVRVDLDNVRRAYRALQGAANTTSGNLSIGPVSAGGASTN